MAAQRLDLGRVIRRTFAAIARNLPAVAGLALLFSALPDWLISMAGPEVSGAPLGDFGNQSVLRIVGFVAAIILQGALIRMVLVDAQGQKAAFGDCLGTGARHFLPVLGVTVIMGVALVAGFVLLIVPGLMMMTAWGTAVPAQIAESRGVFESFSRSADLTRGERWRILGIYLLFLVAVFVVAGVIRTAIGGMLSAPVALSVAVGAVLESVIAVIGAMGAAAIYLELRRAKEGAAPEDLASVFD